MNPKNSYLTEHLFSLADETYKHFQSKLLPGINPDTVIGIRTPVLRRFAEEFSITKQAAQFLNHLPHTYYEENNLHAFLIEKITDFDRLVSELNRFLPHVNNWATCDMMAPKIFSANKEKLLSVIEGWLASPHIYMVRFGIVMLLKHFLNEAFSTQHLRIVANIFSDEYYIKMAQAWYFAEALVKQYDHTLPYLQNNLLPPFIHNKAICKACDSFRISEEKKDFLKTLRRKNST